FFIYTHPDRLHTRSFTTRRSSDLEKRNVQQYTDDLPDWISYAPSNTWPPLKELDPNSFFFDFINKNMNQEMIEYISLYDDLQEMKVPALFISGWFDSLLKSTIMAYKNYTGP